MKKIINIAMLLVLLVSASSCLKSGLDDLPTYDEAKITNIYFEYRWYDDAAKQLRVQTLTLAKTIDEENNTVTCKITVPGTNAVFTEQIRNEVSLSKIVCYIDMSTAARLTPVNAAPTLGEVQDFSAKDFRYLITAANGDKREWTIKIQDFIK